MIPQAMAEKFSFFATTAKGMEELLLGEIKELGALSAEATRAGVKFEGTLKTAYRACLWSRIANRILFPIKTFAAPTPEKLYAGIKSIRWSEHLSPQNTLAVEFSSTQSKITHTHFGALKVKDAIVDQFRSIQGARPSVSVQKPDLQINVYLFKDEATVSIDLSGESLHKRGYREEGVFAPLKENLAAAILMLAEWPRISKETEGPVAFLDPMCGSGTLPIEAAMIAANIAPGLYRDYFGFLKWKGHKAETWKEILEEAQAKVIPQNRNFPKIIGFDEDFRAVRIAIQNVEKARLRGRVHIEKRQFSGCEPVTPRGLIVINPPYGERLGETEELKTLYRQMGDVFKQRFKGWTGYIFTGNRELAKNIGLKPARKHVLFNGALECRLLRFELY